MGVQLRAVHFQGIVQLEGQQNPHCGKPSGGQVFCGGGALAAEASRVLGTAGMEFCRRLVA